MIRNWIEGITSMAIVIFVGVLLAYGYEREQMRRDNSTAIAINPAAK